MHSSGLNSCFLSDSPQQRGHTSAALSKEKKGRVIDPGCSLESRFDPQSYYICCVVQAWNVSDRRWGLMAISRCQFFWWQANASNTSRNTTCSAHPDTPFCCTQRGTPEESEMSNPLTYERWGHSDTSDSRILWICASRLCTPLWTLASPGRGRPRQTYFSGDVTSKPP